MSKTAPIIEFEINEAVTKSFLIGGVSTLSSIGETYG